MADSDKNILITPNVSQTSQPEMKFVGKDNSPMFLKVLDDNTLSFEGTEGQVFSINPTMSSGDIFSVNDISGIQSIVVNANGTVALAPVSGNVGIGTTSPTFASGGGLHIKDGTQANLRLEENTGEFFDVAMQNGDAYLINRVSDGFISLRTNSTDRIRITSGGSVGIGDTTPAEKLQVAGNIRVNNNGAIKADGSGHLTLGNTNNGLINVGGDGGVSFIEATSNHLVLKTQRDSDDIIFSVNAGGTESDGTAVEALRIHGPDGNIGIGTSSPAFPLDVDGFISTSSGIVHTGDTNNTITFGTDTQSFNTGSASRMDISDSGVRFGDAGARITTIKDEDAMGSNSATALATQQSIKAYVDANAGGGLSGGESVAFTHNTTATLTLEQNSTLDNALILKLIGKNNEVLTVKNTGAVFFNLSAAGGGTSEGVLTYRDTAGSARTFLTIDGGTIIHNNRGPSGDLEFRANNSTGGASGESVKAQIKHDRVIIKSHVIGDIVSVTSGHTLTQAESGATVVWTGGVLALPADPEDGTHYLIFNLTGSDAAVNFGSGDATHSSLASGATPQVKNDGSLHFIYVGNNDWVWTK